MPASGRFTMSLRVEYEGEDASVVTRALGMEADRLYPPGQPRIGIDGRRDGTLHGWIWTGPTITIDFYHFDEQLKRIATIVEQAFGISTARSVAVSHISIWVFAESAVNTTGKVLALECSALEALVSAGIELYVDMYATAEDPG